MRVSEYREAQLKIERIKVIIHETDLMLESDENTFRFMYLGSVLFAAKCLDCMAQLDELEIYALGYRSALKTTAK